MRLDGPWAQCSSCLFYRLFKTDLSLSRPLVVAYTYKTGPNPVSQGYRYFLQLHTTGSPTRIFLDPFSSGDEAKEVLLPACGLSRSCEVPSLPGCVLAPISERHSAVLHQLYTGKAEQGDTWKTRLAFQELTLIFMEWALADEEGGLISGMHSRV